MVKEGMMIKWLAAILVSLMYVAGTFHPVWYAIVGGGLCVLFLGTLFAYVTNSRPLFRDTTTSLDALTITDLLPVASNTTPLYVSPLAAPPTPATLAYPVYLDGRLVLVLESKEVGS